MNRPDRPKRQLLFHNDLLEVINHPRHTVNRHRTGTPKLNIRIKKEFRLRGNSYYPTQRRIVLNEGSTQRWQRAKILRKMPSMKRASGIRPEQTRNLTRLIAILSPSLLIAKDITISSTTSSTLTINLLIVNSLFTKMRQSGPLS